MPYLVLEAKKKGTQHGREFSFAPNGWVDQFNGVVYWPRSGMISKRKNEEYSVFETNWIPQPIVKIRHKELSFDEADELAEHYFHKASETETDDSEWERTNISRSDRAKKRLAPQLASLPKTTMYSLSIKDSLPESILKSPDNNATKLKESPYEKNIAVRDVNGEMFPDGGLQTYSIIKQANGDTLFVSPETYAATADDQIVEVQNIQSEQTTYEVEHEPSNQLISSYNFDVLCQNVNHMRNDIEESKIITKGFAEILAQILSKTSSVDKYISEYLKKTSDSNDHEKFLKELTDEEDFTDLESRETMKSTQDLENFEQLLMDISFQQRFIRFLKTKFRMNSHENGQTFFTMVIRLLTEPSLFLPYSWKGLNRKKSQNISFEGKHKVFTAFMFRIVRLSDHTKVQTDVDKMFENLLRFKKVNNNRTKPYKKPSSRCRPKAIRCKEENEADETQNEDLEEEQND